MSAGTHRRTRSRGQTLVEFALVAPVLFLMLFGIVEGGRLVWTNHEVVNGTREGARLAMVAGASASPVSQADVTARVLASTAGLQPARLTVATTNLGGAPGESVTVSTTYQYQPIVGMIFGMGTITLSSQSQVTIQR